MAARAWRRLGAGLAERRSALRANWQRGAGIALGQRGQLSQALPVTEEAVAKYRELAAANPGRYRPDLAASLSNLCV